jgi:cytochrome c-type biogenesis protein CcmH
VLERLRAIGTGGLVAAGAVVLAAGVIGYRAWSSTPSPPPAAGNAADPLAALEQKAQANPGNAQGWQELGFEYFQLQRFAEAANAYRRATQADPKSAVLWSSLGEALARASEHDPMPPEARVAFAKAVSIDPKDPRARYFQAIEKDLAGDHKGALDAWLALLADTPPGAPWEADLRRTIEQVGSINKIEVAPRLAAATANRPAAAPAMPAVPGPDAQQLAAASSIPPSEQQQMAEGMVARLAARLEQQPANVDGWIMLIRSYKTLGRDAEARIALAKARAANPGARNQLDAAAATLGVS